MYTCSIKSHVKVVPINRDHGATQFEIGEGGLGGLIRDSVLGWGGGEVAANTLFY